MPLSTHTRIMENNSKTTTAKKAKKQSAMKKLGKSIKDTFIEMSASLAGWIDDTGNQFAGKKKSNNTANNTAKKTSTTTQHRSTSSQSNK